MWENIIREQDFVNQVKLRAVMAAFAESLQPTYFVTANFNRDISYEGAKQALKAWHARVDRKLLGPKWLEKPFDARTEFLATVEHLSSNPHWHLLVRPAGHAGGMTFEDVGEQVWHALQPAGSLDIRPLLTRRDMHRVSRYCVKDLMKSENYERFVLSREFSYGK